MSKPKVFTNDAWRAEDEHRVAVRVTRTAGSGPIRYGTKYLVEFTRDGVTTVAGYLRYAAPRGWWLDRDGEEQGQFVFYGDTERAAWNLVTSTPGYYEGRKIVSTEEV